MATNDGADEDEPPSGTDRTGGFLDWVLSGTPCVAFAVDERGRLTWWNDRLPAVTGHDPACLDALPAVELFASDPRMHGTDCVVSSGGRTGRGYRSRRPTGGRSPTISTGRPVPGRRAGGTSTRADRWASDRRTDGTATRPSPGTRG
ncbi:MAG: hypothetical protein V5A62_04260 [Haloarculaceae archaeon]